MIASWGYVQHYVRRLNGCTMGKGRLQDNVLTVESECNGMTNHVCLDQSGAIISRPIHKYGMPIAPGLSRADLWLLVASIRGSIAGMYRLWTHTPLLCRLAWEVAPIEFSLESSLCVAWRLPGDGRVSKASLHPLEMVFTMDGHSVMPSVAHAVNRLHLATHIGYTYLSISATSFEGIEIDIAT